MGCNQSTQVQSRRPSSVHIYQNEEYVQKNIQFSNYNRRKIFFNQLGQLDIMVYQLLNQFQQIKLKKDQKSIQDHFKNIKKRWKHIKIIFQLIKNTFPQFKNQQYYQQVLQSQETAQYFNSLKQRNRNELIENLSNPISAIKNQLDELNSLLVANFKSRNGKAQKNNRFINVQSKLEKNIQKWILVDGLAYCLLNQNETKILRIQNGKQIKQIIIKQINPSLYSLKDNQSIYTIQDLENIKNADNNQINKLRKQITDHQLKKQKEAIQYLQKLKQSYNDNFLLKENLEKQKQCFAWLQNKYQKLQIEYKQLQIKRNNYEQHHIQRRIINSSEIGSQCASESKINIVRELKQKNYLIKQDSLNSTNIEIKNKYEILIEENKQIKKIIQKQQFQIKQLLEEIAKINSDKQSLSQKEKENQINDNKLKILNEKNQILIKQNNQDQILIHSLQEKVRNYKEQIQKSKSINEQLNFNVKELQDEINCLKGEKAKRFGQEISIDYEQKNKELNIYKEINANLIKKNQKLEQQYQIKEKLLDRINEEKLLLTKKNGEDQMIILQQLERLKKLEEQSELIKQENEKLNTRIKQKLEVIIFLENQVKQHKYSNESIIAENKKLLNHYKEREMQLIMETQKLKENEINVHRLRQMEDNMKNESEKAKSLAYDIQRIAADNELLKKQLSQSKDQINYLKSSVEQLKSDNLRITTDNDKLLNHYKEREMELIMEIQKLKENEINADTLRQMENQIKKLRYQVAQAQILRQEISKITFDKMEIKKQLNQSKVREIDLIKLNQKKTRQMEEINNLNQKLKNQCETQRILFNKIKQQNKKLVNQNEKGQIKLIQQEERIRNFEEQISRIKLENKYLSSRVKQMQNEINNLKNQIDQLKYDIQRIAADNELLKKQLSQSKDQINYLKSSVEQLKSDNLRITTDNDKLLNHYKEREMELIMEIQKLKENEINADTLRQMEDQTNSLKNQIDQLNYNNLRMIKLHQQQINHYKEREMKLIMEIQKLKENDISLNSTLYQSKYNNISQNSQSNISNLQQQMVQLASQNQKLRSQIKQLSHNFKLQTTIFPGSEIVSNIQLKTIFLQYSQLAINSSKLIYRASEREFKEFHPVCKNKKNIVVIALAQNSNIFGGFTNIPFTSESAENQIDSKRQSFLFRIKNNQFIKLKILEKKCPIIYDDKFGPIFGESQIRLKDRNCFSNYGIQSGRYFKDPRIESYKSFFGGEQSFKIKQYEVYQIMFL